MPRFEVVPATLNVRAGPGTDYEILDTLKKEDIVEEVSVEGWCVIQMEDGTVAWVARKYLTLEAVGGAAPVVTMPGAEPIWIRWARSKLGQKEVPGPGDNPEIASWYHLTTLPENLWHDATAWCAVFVNAAFMLNNIKTIRSARAFDWMEAGKAVSVPQKGDVVIFSFSHVAFFLRDLGDRIEVIGGNQSDAVTITTYKKSTVEGYRRVA